MRKRNIILIPALAIGVVSLSGCVKPYDKPEFVEIQPNQTAFVIPLEGKTSDQGKFESEEFLMNAQVASKRIEIPHKWVQTGRRNWKGKYMDTVRVIVVDRFPETREWSGEKDSFVGESQDSIKFNQGMSATAQILEEDTAKFLYQYAGKKLEDVMNTEIRNKVGSVLLESYGAKTIDDIRADKGAIIASVREEVEPYFKERGITLSNIGYIDDLKYLQPEIQEAINKDFVRQQEQKAQRTANATNEETALSELKQNQTRKAAMAELVEMKELEIKETLAKGLSEGKIKLPDTLVINGDGEGMLFNLPIQSNTTTKKE